MKKAILATKVGMTQIFDENGVLIPVTVLQAGPCVVTQVKTVENDGYSAVQVGFVDKKEKIVNKDKSGKKELLHRRSKQMFSKPETRSMQQRSPKVKVSRVRSNVTTSTEDL